MRHLQAFLGYGLTLTLAYCWTRAIVSVEIAQGDQAASGLGLMLLLAVGPLTVLYLFLYTAALFRRVSFWHPSVIALTQTLGTGWGWLVLDRTVQDTGGPFLLGGSVAALGTVGLMALLALRRAHRSTPVELTT